MHPGRTTIHERKAIKGIAWRFTVCLHLAHWDAHIPQGHAVWRTAVLHAVEYGINEQKLILTARRGLSERLLHSNICCLFSEIYYSSI